MEDHFAVRESMAQCRSPTEITLDDADDAGSVKPFPATRAEVVEDHDVVSPGDQAHHQVVSDEAGPTGHQDPHSEVASLGVLSPRT